MDTHGFSEMVPAENKQDLAELLAFGIAERLTFGVAQRVPVRESIGIAPRVAARGGRSVAAAWRPVGASPEPWSGGGQIPQHTGTAAGGEEDAHV